MKKLIVLIVLAVFIVASTGISPPVAAFIEANIEAVEAAKERGSFWVSWRPVPKQSFDDVPPDHWAYDEIELIFLYGVTVGCSYDPPLYCPDRPATRAEMAVFAARLIELMEDK